MLSPLLSLFSTPSAGRRRGRISGFVVCLLVTSAAVAEGRSDELAVLEGPRALAPVDLADAPGATTVITAEEIAASAADNIFDLLRRVPGLSVRYTPMGGHLSIRSAGSSAFSVQLLLLIDGSPYNSPDKGGFPGHPNYHGFFPLHRIERIEVIRGPISVVYGPNAFGGVINIVSRKASDALGDRLEGSVQGMEVELGERSHLLGRYWMDYVKGPWELSAEVSHQGGIAPVRVTGDTNSQREGLYLSARRGNFMASALRQESSHDSFDFGGRASTHQAKSETTVVDAHYQRQVAGFAVEASATLNHHRGTTCAVCHNAGGEYPDRLETGSLFDEREEDTRLQLELRADRVVSAQQDVNFGMELAFDRIDRQVVELPGSPEEQRVLGLYTQHQWHSKKQRLHLLSGFRLDSLERLGSVLSPRIALVAQPSDSVMLRASVARAYRAPTWNERFIRQRFLPGLVADDAVVMVYGGPDTDRERIDSVEGGLAWQLSPRTTVRLDLFANEIHDLITLFPRLQEDPVRENQYVYGNRAESFDLRGGELSFDARPRSDLLLRLGFAHKDTSLPADSPDAAYASRNELSASVLYQPFDRWSLNLDASYKSSFLASFPDVFGVRRQDGYLLADAGLRRSFDVAGRRFHLGVLARNLLDEEAIETLVGTTFDTRLRGRQLVFEMRFDF